MGKSHGYSFSKKSLPGGSKRITNSLGKRVWVINGKEFDSAREYFISLQKKEIVLPEEEKAE